MTRHALRKLLTATVALAAMQSCGGDAPTDIKTTIRRVELTSPRTAFVIGKRLTVWSRSHTTRKAR